MMYTVSIYHESHKKIGPIRLDATNMAFSLAFDTKEEFENAYDYHRDTNQPNGDIIVGRIWDDLGGAFIELCRHRLTPRY